MKVLLVQLPHYVRLRFTYCDGKAREPAFFPIGLGTIAKALLKCQHRVEVFDIWAHQYTNDEVLAKAKELEYDVVGISALSTQYGYVKWLVAQLRKLAKIKKIVVGGPLATHTPELVLSHTETDICVLGEGEITMREVVENIDNLKKVKGIYYKLNDEIIKNPPREPIKDLDKIDFPAWDLFPIEIYLKNSYLFTSPILNKDRSFRVMHVVTSRGCPYKCRFCSKTFKGVRLRSIDNVIEEIKELKEKFNVNAIFFNDELLMISKKRMYELCDKIKKLDIKWQCQGRVNVADLHLLRSMRQAGCVAVGYGIESGSQTILNSMNKQITVDQSVEALKNTIRANLVPVIQMMYGYTGENQKTLQETVDFYRRVPYGAACYSIATPLPGTELYKQAIRKELIADEERYLEQLSAGYDGDTFLVNLTDFTEEEFYRFKRETENKMRRAFLSHLLKKNQSALLKITGINIKEDGFKETMKKAFSILK